MGKEANLSTTEEIFAAPLPNGEALRSAVNRTLASSSVNPIAAGNQAIRRPSDAALRRLTALKARTVPCPAPAAPDSRIASTGHR